MNSEENNQDVAVDVDNGSEESNVDVVTVSREEYEKLNQTLGSYKRELKDLKKSKEETKESSTTTKPDDALLQKVERIALRTAGITHEDDIELAKKTAQKWGMDIDEVLLDEDFKVKLERQQSGRSNVEATSGVRGSSAGASQAKNTPEYWIAKGVPPSPTDVPDSATRRKIARAMLNSAQGSGKMKFYND